MIEHAIQNDVDLFFAGVFHQILPILLRAKVGIDLIVILGVVAVVGTRIEDRVEINGGNAEGLEIVERLIHTLEVAAEIITAARLFLGWAVGGRGGVETPRTIRRAIGVIAAVSFRQCTPFEFEHRVIVADIAGLRVIVGAAVEEAVGEDLIDAGALCPAGR